MANQVVYGYETLQDRFNQRVEAVGVDVVNDATTTAFQFHNQQMDTLMSLFVRKTTRAKQRFNHPFTTRNQPLDQYGYPLPVKGAAHYEVAFPLHGSGNRIGWTYKDSHTLTVQDINDRIYSIQMGDMRWVFDHILAALFQDDGWAYADDDDDIGSLTIEGLANGDSYVYNTMSGGDTGATDDHIQAQANAIGSGSDNPFPAIYTDLAEHPENGSGPIISFIPTNLKASVVALGTFNTIRDPNLTPGSGTDVLTGTLGVAVPGGDSAILGYEDSKVWVVEYPRLPDDYVVSVAAGGSPPLGMREPEAAAEQGFAEIPADMDRSPFPFMHRTWTRWAGMGGWNRVGARVDRIGNGTYAVPTNFTSPMP